jgi:hypothetical protein
MTQMITNSLNSLLVQHKVVIPPIQRDYAQGRSTGKIPHIRERFLTDIVNVLINDTLPTLELDFVYGYVEKEISGEKEITRFKPLDGQQRLTTLFLLHWYISSKEPINVVDNEFLKKFTYATREGSRRFCEELTNFKPSFTYESIDKEIVDQPWFFSAWKSDPTIESMLVVLKAIENKLNAIYNQSASVNLWQKLTGISPRIIFHLLPMDDLGLPDDLYIKMNARGKALTDFEHFKSQFSEVLSNDRAKEFNVKIDKQWSDLFWNIFKNAEGKDLAKKVDSGFLGFFWYITDLLINKNKIDIKSNFWLDKVKEVYHNSEDNVTFLFQSLDLFEKLEKEDLPYFHSIFYISSNDFELNKTRIFFNNPDINLFRKCAETYGFDEKKNTFSVGEQLLLYAFIFIKLNHIDDRESVFRMLRNIFASSEDQLRNEFLSKFLYEDVESIIVNNYYSEDSKLSKRQLEEEMLKIQLITNNPELKESVYRLEDHGLLRGNISILPLNNSLSIYANQFHNIFKHDCNYFEISRAMLTIGDYSQNYGNLKRFGNKNASTWRELFTRSESRKGFDNTSVVLKSYLDLFVNNNTTTNKGIVTEYLEHFEQDNNYPKDWRYYYIKYQSFILWNNISTEGFYKWDDFTNKPYKSILMFKQYGGRSWSPFLLEISKMSKNLSLDNYGNDLQFTNGDIILLIKNGNSGFKFYAKDEQSQAYIDQLIAESKLNENSILTISKDENGIDIEDRIIKCHEFLNYINI